MIALLGVDWFWSAWLAVVAIVELLVAILGLPDLAPSWLYPVPIYVAAAGVASIVYAIVYEFAAHPPVGDRAAESQRRDNPQPVSTGESVIPAGIGNALVILAVFLDAAFFKGDPVIAFVGLPVVFVTAPFFALFAFGYIRGQPDVGGFAYRTMPWGLVGFLLLSGLVLAGRQLGWDLRGILVVIGIIGVAVLGVNVGINIQRRRPAE
jgi:hypothetical protein